jgi:hypothetical protein
MPRDASWVAPPSGNRADGLRLARGTSAAPRLDMPNTEPAITEIDTTILADVSGGCGRKRRCGGCNNSQQVVNNYYAAPAAPAAPVAPLQPASTGISTDVSVTYA